MAEGRMDLGLIGEEGLATVKMLNEQTYNILPALPYLRLDDEHADRYGDSSPGDKEYREFPVKMKANVSAAEIGISSFSMTLSRTIAFIAPISFFDSLGFDPETGDAIKYDGGKYEVKHVIRKPESRIGHTNEYLEFIFETELLRRERNDREEEVSS